MKLKIPKAQPGGSQPTDLGLKIGTKEQAFLTEELRAAKDAMKLHKKAITANAWLIPLYEKRLKEIEDEN